MESKHFAFTDGMPTRPDVDLLLKTWLPADLTPGRVIPYDEVSQRLGIALEATRFRTITNVWRKRLLESGIVLNCVDGQGFRVADSREIASATYDVLRFARRKIHKQRRKLSVAKPDSDLQRQEIEHHARLLLVHEKDLRKTGMNLLPATNVQSTPRINPPEPDSPAMRG